MKISFLCLYYKNLLSLFVYICVNVFYTAYYIFTVVFVLIHKHKIVVYRIFEKLYTVNIYTVNWVLLYRSFINVIRFKYCVYILLHNCTLKNPLLNNFEIFKCHLLDVNNHIMRQKIKWPNSNKKKRAA